MNDFGLNFLQDSQGNYILKHFQNGEFEYLQENKNYIIHSGEYKNNLIISTTFFSKKLQHKLEDIVRDIEKMVLINQKIKREDILSEKMVAELKSEKDFNPLFATMTNEEIDEYTMDSTKIRVIINYEFHIKPKSHLMFGSFLNSLKKSLKGN